VKNISTHLASQKPEQKQPGIHCHSDPGLGGLSKNAVNRKWEGRALKARGGTFFLAGGGLGPQRRWSSVKVSTKRGGPYLT